MSIDSAYTHIVQYYETDQMAVVHHSNYIRWLEEARMWWMEQIGFSYDRLEAAGVMIPVLGVTCDYKKPTRFGETAAIKMKLTKFNGIEMDVAYAIYGQGDPTLRAQATSRHCFLDVDSAKLLNLKKTHPDVYQLFIAQLED